MGSWNWLDFILAAVVIVSVLAAARKGFIRELISLAGLLAGLTVAALGYKHAAGWFEDLARSHEVALGAGFLTLFLGTVLLAAVVSALAGKLIKKAGLQRADRLLGAGFGLVRGLAADCILLMALVAFSIKPEAVQRSVLAPYVATGAGVIALVMPEELKQQFRSGFEKLKQAITQEEEDKKAKKN